MLWMCLHFPKLALEVFTQNQDIETPFAIEERKTNKRLVLLCNEEAEADGLQAGMTMPTAHSLCEHLVVKERDPLIENKALEQIALLMSQFSPTITIQAPDNILLEIGSCLRLFGGLKNLHHKVQIQMQHFNYSYKLAVAKTPLAAEIAARLLEDESKFLISNAYLKQIPIHELNYRHDTKTLKRLQGMGFRRLGDILDLPKAALGKRFGKSFLIYLDKLTGKTLDSRDVFEPPTFFEHHIHFIEELTVRDSLLFPLKRLLDDMEKYLQQRQQEASSVVILLKDRTNQTTAIDIKFAEPQYRSNQILPLIQLKFETLTLSEPIITVGIKADQLVEQEIKIKTLFFQEDPTYQDGSSDSHKATLINRLTARLGDDQVQSLKLLDDHRPENCWTYTPPVVKAPRKTTIKSFTPIKQARPLWLLPQPQQLPIREGQPFWHGPLTLLNGPERIHTGWWDRNPVNRDYFIAQHKQGELLWIYKDRENIPMRALKREQWFLHGIFS